MANITSAGTGNSNDGATWTGGSVPTSSDNAIIQNGHTVTQNAAHTFKSLRVETGGTWTADGSNHLTLSGENDSDFALQIVDGTYNHANGTVVINNGGGGIAHAAIQAGDATSTTGLYDLTISGGGTTCEIYGDTTIHRNMEAGGSTTVLRGALTVNGNLTVNGILNTQYSSTDRNLTVAGALTNDGTLTLNSSTVNLGSTSTEAGDVTGAGTFNLDTSTINYHTGGNANFNPSTSANFDTNTSTLNLIGLDSSIRAHNFKFNSGNMHNVTTSRGAGSGTHIDKLAANCTITGDLTVGVNSKFSSGTRVFTVNGDVSVTGELDCDDSDKPMTFGSLTINSGGTYNATTGTTTLTGKTSSGNYSLDNQGTISGTLNVKVTGDGGHIREQGTGGINNLEVDLGGSSEYHRLSDSTTITGNLTITEGDFQPNGRNLTVAGTTTIGPNSGAADQATLTCSSGDMSLGASQTSSYALRVAQGGTFTGGTGTHTIGSLEVVNNAAAKCTLTNDITTISSERTSTNRAISIAGTDAVFNHGSVTVKLTNPASTVLKTNFNDLYNLIIDHATVVGKYTDNFVIANNLTINQGTFEADAGDENLTVTGDVTVGDGTGSANTAVLGHSGDDTATNTFGSLTIASDGEYQATSGTTTITDEGDGSSGTNGYAWYNVTGTYTHNNGTVKFTGNSDTDIREDAFYNLIINGDTSSVDFYIRQKDGSSSSSGHIKIFNNLDIQRGGFQRAKSANELSVFGIIDICSGGTGGYFGDTSDTGIYNLGAVNIHNNGTLNLSNGDNNINSIRNIAGTVAQD